MNRNNTAASSYLYYDYAILPLYEVYKDRFSEWQNAGRDRPDHYLDSLLSCCLLSEPETR